MNKKGQVMDSMGIIIGVFIVVLVGLILFTTIAQENSRAIELRTVANDTITAPANGDDISFTEVKTLSDFVAINASNGAAIDSGNYTLTDNQVVNGQLVAVLTVDAVTFESVDWNVSYTGQPTGYITSSGGRAIAGLIPLMFAIGLVIVALTPTLKSKILDSLGK